ncbi:hypothetical protein GCM10010885_10170 [Alicyclobacillus cellulosilyticus]|uniref:Uncharacterized protein n=1 Tax=Alicyclobacillus cellulosilyticus TaxID=1003997 RepID=A0A917K7H0_9BACL|nr:hypothetical protein GCM10010885_10170 [Alicyclobacillus cellulosilyticus]
MAKAALAAVREAERAAGLRGGRAQVPRPRMQAARRAARREAGPATRVRPAAGAAAPGRKAVQERPGGRVTRLRERDRQAAARPVPHPVQQAAHPAAAVEQAADRVRANSRAAV